MKSRKNLLMLIVVAAFSSLQSLFAQSHQDSIPQYECFVGSSMFVLANLVPDDNSPDFAQLNLGYRITNTDVVSIELKTWKYAWSLGIPYGNSFESPEEKFPGYIREYGFALVYQKFFWKGAYAGVHVMNAWQSFFDEENNKIDKGFQIFNTYRLGYQFKLFQNRFFIEPSIAITHRLVHTEMPEGFKELDDQWSKMFFGEPGLHFGMNF